MDHPTKSQLVDRVDLAMKYFDDLIDVTKLQFGVSTGAVVVIVHAIVDSHLRPVLVAILILAVLSFGYSAIMCLDFLLHIADFKHTMRAALLPEKDDTHDSVDIEGAKSTGNKTSRFFKAGVAFSAIFLLVYFFFSLRH